MHEGNEGVLAQGDLPDLLAYEISRRRCRMDLHRKEILIVEHRLLQLLLVSSVQPLRHELFVVHAGGKVGEQVQVLARLLGRAQDEDDGADRPDRSAERTLLVDRQLHAVGDAYENQVREPEPGQAEVGKRDLVGHGHKARPVHLKQPFCQGLRRDGKDVRHVSRDAPDQGLPVHRLFEIEYAGFRYELYEDVLPSHRLFLENPSQLSVESGVSPASQALEEMQDGPFPLCPVAGVILVPERAEADETEGEQHGKDPQLGDEPERKQYAGNLHPGIQGGFETGVIAFKAAFAHHDHRQIDDREKDKLERAGQFRELFHRQNQ